MSLTGVPVTVYGAGRTDAGSHALGQVASFRYGGSLAPERLASALNALLPPDISVLGADEVAASFHARYSARWRHYRYRWMDRPARPALGGHDCWHVARRLDEAAMNRAAQELRGRHDWTTFCVRAPAVHPVREIRELRVGRSGRFVELDLVGEGFLRGLVRGIAGALTEVGRGRRAVGWPAELLAACDRSQAPRTAPARGLTLVEVEYPGTS